jgi:hypothetical protein
LLLDARRGAWFLLMFVSDITKAGSDIIQLKLVEVSF